MRNEEVIHDIKTQSGAILEKLNDRTLELFQLKDLDISEGIYLRDMPIRGRGVGRVLGALKVKSNFTDFQGKLSANDWKTVSEKLKSAEADTKLYAKMENDENGKRFISDIVYHNDKKKHEDTVKLNRYFDWITESLENSEKAYSLEHFHFDPRKEIFNLTLLDTESDFDVVGNGLDFWKAGDQFTLSALSFNYDPFFQRLICSNGAITRDHGFGTYKTRSSFNDRKIEATIQKALTVKSDIVQEQIIMAVNHLQKNNISLAEFYHYKNFIKSKNADGIYDGILSKYFDDTHFYKAYGINIDEKSAKWKSTANSGINAYDFFNLLTWIASHPKEVKMERQDRQELQIKASSLLFKKELDLEDIASFTSVEYPRIKAML